MENSNLHSYVVTIPQIYSYHTVVFAELFHLVTPAGVPKLHNKNMYIKNNSNRIEVINTLTRHAQLEELTRLDQHSIACMQLVYSGLSCMLYPVATIRNMQQGINEIVCSVAADDIQYTL